VPLDDLDGPPPRKLASYKAPKRPKAKPVKPVPAEIDPEVLAQRAIEQKAARAAKKLAYAKRSVRQHSKRLNALKTVKGALDGEGSGLVTDADLAELPPSASDIDDDKIIFRPNPGPQTAFLAATEKEVFFGGARGGGKSMAMIIDPLRFCGNGNFLAIYLRRTMPELRDVIAQTQRIYPKAFPGAKWREQDKVWVFPSGARIEFGFAENMTDVLRYQGRNVTAFYIDELPQYPTSEVLNFLRSSLRSSDPTLQPYIRATGNPGNVGSKWVKEMFIDPAPPGERFEVVVEAQTIRGNIREVITRRFIPSTVFDNPHLLHDNNYLAMLASLPEVQRRQFLEGDWNAYENSAFSEFKTSVHTCPAFEIPTNWQRFRAADWGFSSPACCLWFAVDPADGTLYVYRELYTTKMTADRFAQAVNAAEHGEPIRYGILDASTWSQRGDVGPSIAETMIKEGCRWRPSDRSPRSRVNGKLEMHRRLAVNEETGKPGLIVLDNCRNLIRTLPSLPLDKNNQEDVDTDAEDHAYDACRYGVMSRPITTETPFDLRDVSRVQSFRPACGVFGY
jgi:hypothetical protein